MTVKPIGEKHFAQFEKLFCDYYAELDCEDDPLHLFSEYVLPDLKAGLFNVAGCFDGETLTGFVIFQIDDPVNDWNFKDGDVRELYVLPSHRRNGAGAQLVAYAENALKAQGATEVYLLPTEESEDFFIKCGYGFGGEYCEDTDGKVYFKLL